MPLLEVSDLSVSYGRGVALEGLSVRCREGEILSLVGPNGAGKTSALMAIAGVLRRGVNGQVRFREQDIAGRSPEAIAGLGLSMVPETRRAFTDLTVHENLLVGAMRLPRQGERERAIADVYERIPTLGRLRTRLAGQLSGGEQQLMVIARAVIGRPVLLLLDEPSLGLSPVAIHEVYELLRDLVRVDGMSAILVEQNALHALQLATDCVVLRSGRVELEGPAAQLRQDRRFLDAYFGIAAEAEEETEVRA